MPRYVQGTRPAYTPIDYEHILGTVRAAGLRSDGRAYRLAAEIVRRARSEHTALSYSHELAAWLRFCRAQGLDPLRVTRSDVDRYTAENGRYAIGTQHGKLLVARLFYKAAIEHGWVRRNPVVIPPSIRSIPETDTPALTRAQLELVLGAIALEFNDPRVGLTAKRDFAMIKLMVRLCLRATETAQLRWGRITESNGQRRVAFRGKGAKPAVLPVPPDVWETLAKWKRAFEAATGTVLGPGDPVFVGVSSRDLARAPAGRRGEPAAGGWPLPRLPGGDPPPARRRAHRRSDESSRPACQRRGPRLPRRCLAGRDQEAAPPLQHGDHHALPAATARRGRRGRHREDRARRARLDR